MPWFRLEGRGAFHHKVLAAGNEAYGAWCRAGQWSSDQLTDGFVPASVAEQIAKPKVWAKLIEANLIDEADGGYQIHDFLDWNPSSEQERARRDEMREKRREAGRAGGKKSGESRRSAKQDASASEATTKQTRSNDEANAKQSASTGASVLLQANAKQNEAPSPIPIPILLPSEEDKIPPTPHRGAGSVVVQEPHSEPPPPPPPPERPRRGRKGAEALALPGVGAEPADDIFQAYLEARNRVAPGGAPPVLDAKRRKLVRARLEEGHPVARLKAAAAGIFDSDWNVTEKRTEFDLALRDAEHVERFAACLEAAEAARRPPPPKPAWLNQLHRRTITVRDVERMAAEDDRPFDDMSGFPVVPEVTA